MSGYKQIVDLLEHEAIVAYNELKLRGVDPWGSLAYHWRRISADELRMRLRAQIESNHRAIQDMRHEA